jgi:GAF domain-containing protein
MQESTELKRSTNDEPEEYEDRIIAFVRSQLDLSRLIREASQKLILGVGDEQIFEFLFDHLGQLIPYDRIGVALIDAQTNTVSLKWVKSKIPFHHITKNYSAPLQGNDLLLYLREHPNSSSTKLIVQDGIMSSLTCPLIAGGRPIGFIFFSNKSRNTYSEEHADTFLEIAEELSIVVEQQRLRESRATPSTGGPA